MKATTGTNGRENGLEVPSVTELGRGDLVFLKVLLEKRNTGRTPEGKGCAFKPCSDS